MLPRRPGPAEFASPLTPALPSFSCTPSLKSAMADQPTLMLSHSRSFPSLTAYPCKLMPFDSPEEVFREFKSRRAAILKALTTDLDTFFQDYNPENVNLFIFHFCDATGPIRCSGPVFSVAVPRNLPREDWIVHVATHSDSWLHSFAFYYSVQSGFGRNDKKRLFELIDSIPTIHQQVAYTGPATKAIDVLPLFSLSLSVSHDDLLYQVLPSFGPGKLPKDVFDDFKGRRAGIIRALTTDSWEFFGQCATAKCDDLFLFGKPDGSWHLAEPIKVLEPSTDSHIPFGNGIQFSRNGLPGKPWFGCIAAQSDCWLLSIAS